MPEQKSFLPKLSSFRFVDESGTVHVSVQHKEWIPCCQRSSQRPVNIAYYYSIKRPNERNVTRTIFFSASSRVKLKFSVALLSSIIQMCICATTFFMLRAVKIEVRVIGTSFWWNQMMCIYKNFCSRCQRLHSKIPICMIHIDSTLYESCRLEFYYANVDI